MKFPKTYLVSHRRILLNSYQNVKTFSFNTKCPVSELIPTPFTTTFFRTGEERHVGEWLVQVGSGGDILTSYL